MMKYFRRCVQQIFFAIVLDPTVIICTDLSKGKFIVVNRIQAIPNNKIRAKLLPDRVVRQPVHVNLHVGGHGLVGEELRRDDLRANYITFRSLAHEGEGRTAARNIITARV